MSTDDYGYISLPFSLSNLFFFFKKKGEYMKYLPFGVVEKP